MGRADRHDEIELNLVEHGFIEYLFHGQKVKVLAGQLTAFWAAIPHQIVGFSEATPYFVATIPLAWVLQWRLPQSFIHRLLNGEMICDSHDAQSSSDRELFLRWTRDAQQEDPSLKAAMRLEMEARLFRLSASLQPPRKSAKALSLTDAASSAVERIARYIALHYCEEITVADVSRSANLHPNYAMSLFSRTFGTTMTAYINQNRVAHAQRLLVMSDKSVLEIALESGFGSQSRFHAVFKEASNCSPRQYRQSHRFDI